jgi:hypothetical protein
MAASMYIVVQGEDPGYDIYVNGRALAQHEDALEKLAVKIGVKPLIEFFSADENLMALLVEVGSHEVAMIKQLPPPQWFRGEDGLLTVRALIDALQDEPQVLGSEGVLVLEELREYEVVLRKTAERGTRWHMAVSFR